MDVRDTLESKINSVVISKITRIIIQVFQTRVSRGSSYIATPDKLGIPKCGLTNIQNDDGKCFYWCMKYHSSTKVKHSYKLSDLNKLED